MARFPETKRRFLVAKLGEARVRRLEEMLPAWAKELEDEGVAYKEVPNSPVAGYIDDWLAPSKPSAKAIKAAEAVPFVGVYIGDLIAGRVVKGEG